MRLQWLWLLTAPALFGAIFVPWGEKHIDDHHCETYWDEAALEGGRACTSDEWNAAYQPFSMHTVHTEHSFVDSQAEGQRWAYAYTSPEAPHQEGITPLLTLAGPVLMLGGSALIVSGATHQVMRMPITRLAARVGWALYAAAILWFIAGMAYHAGTWSAEEIDHLAPAKGLLLGIIPLLAGVPLLPAREPSQGLPSLPAWD